jgi:hypothetical protein
MGICMDDCGSPEKIFRPAVVAPRAQPVPMAAFTQDQEFAAAMAGAQIAAQRNELIPHERKKGKSL